MKAMYLSFLLFFRIFYCYSKSDQSLILNNVAVEEMNKQDLLSAFELLSRAIKEDSLNSLFFQKRAYCYFFDGQYEKSGKDFLQCLSLGDEKPDYFYYLGLAGSKMKDNETAINYFGRAINLDPQNHKYYYHRAICYMKTGSFGDAVNDFHLSVRLNPQHAGSYFYRGQSFHMLRNNRAACMDWIVAEKLDSQLTASQFEEFCSGEEYIGWYDVESLIEQERLCEPVFRGKGFEEFQKYFAKNTRVPADLLYQHSNLYSVRRFSVLADGAIGDIEKILSGSNLLDRSAEKTIRKSERKWEGGSVNGIPADFLYVADIAFSTSTFIHESERLKKLIDEANEIGDTATALKYCNEILVVYPYDHDVLRMRLVLNSRLGNEAEVAADEELLKKLNEVKFRYRPDRIFDKEAALLPVPEDSVTVFYNRDWHITSRGNAVYFRKGVWSFSRNFFTGTVYDYLLEDGSMVSQVTYTPELKKTGIYIFRSPNGNKLAEGNFEKDRMSGSWNFYKEDGNLHYVVSFSDDQFEFESLIDDQMNDAVLADNQDFELILNDVFVLSGTFENGKRAKTWKLEVNGRTLLQEVYKEDEFESGFYFNNGERLPLSSSQLKSVIFNPGRLEIIETLVFDNRESFDSYEFINTDVLK